MNEYLSEEIPFNDIPHDHILAIKICKGLRPKISEEPVNSSDLTSFQVISDDVPSISTILVSECFDVQLSELDLNKINQEEDNLNDET
ncbi:unnamed protein product [Rhizophagus irregularis]|nr:unnamed protein product [Rhizophagus irregularis]